MLIYLKEVTIFYKMNEHSFYIKSIYSKIKFMKTN